MPELVETIWPTLMILAWVGCISFASFTAIFLLQGRKGLNLLRSLEQLQLPAMILAPLLVLTWHFLWRQPLSFPVSFFSSWWRLAMGCLPPATVLLFASGFLPLMIRMELRELADARSKPFFTVARAFGKRPGPQIWSIVVGSAYANAWLRSLPLLFSELLMVEVIFNAPGLGQAAWQAAKGRDGAGLLSAIGLMIAVYGAVMTAALMVSRRTGRRMQGYA